MSGRSNRLWASLVLGVLLGAGLGNPAVAAEGCEHSWTFPRPFFQSVAWSPDSGTLAVAAVTGGWDEGYGILLIDAEGGDPRRVRTGGDSDLYPVFSPDGRRLAYASKRGGTSDLWVLDLESGGRRQLTRTDANDSYPGWSPDGSSIVFHSDRTGSYDVWVMRSDGSEARRLTDHPADDYNPAFSPDGSQIVFESERDGVEGDEIYVMESDGGGVRKIADGVFPTWAPAGDEVLYEADHALWTVGAGGDSPPRRLAERAVYAAWAPDGSAIAAATFDYDDDCRDHHALTLLDPGGSERHRLLPADPAEPTVEWLGPGVFAVLQPETGRFDDSNSVVVERDGGLLVIDAQASLAATRRTIEAIRRRSDLPVRHLVLTHWHGDHVQGAAAYRELWPEVQVVGHLTLEADIRERAEAQLAEDAALYEQAIADARERLERGVDREGEALDTGGKRRLAEQIDAAEARLAGMRAIPRPLAVPDLAYGEELVLGTGPDAVRLLHHRAHTRGDTIVHLPSAGVLVTGDVLDDLPFGGHGYPSSWIAALDGLAELDFELVVPGHGRIRRGRAHLERVLAMFRSLVEQVDAAVDRELDLEATRSTVDLEPFRRDLVGDDPVAARVWEPFIQPTIERVWLESRGELPADR